jgi:hypothetical protein
MRSRYAVSALLLGAALIATTPSDAAWRHPVVAHGPHARFAFHHDFHHFSPIEHRWWVGGRWRHFWWHGRYGWWWGVGGAWYFYDAPVYPYPTDVSPTYYDEDDQSGYIDGGDQGGPGYGGGGGGSWYHCANPNGYYPYVQTCKGGWEQVPAQPSDVQGGPGGGPGGDYGPQGGPGGNYGPQGGPGPNDQGPPPPPGR